MFSFHAFQTSVRDKQATTEVTVCYLPVGNKSWLQSNNPGIQWRTNGAFCGKQYVLLQCCAFSQIKRTFSEFQSSVKLNLIPLDAYKDLWYLPHFAAVLCFFYLKTLTRRKLKELFDNGWDAASILIGLQWL